MFLFFFVLFLISSQQCFTELSFKREALTLVNKELSMFPRLGQRVHYECLQWPPEECANWRISSLSKLFAN